MFINVSSMNNSEFKIIFLAKFPILPKETKRISFFEYHSFQINSQFKFQVIFQNAFISENSPPLIAFIRSPFCWTTNTSTYITATHYNRAFHHKKYFYLYIFKISIQNTKVFFASKIKIFGKTKIEKFMFISDRVYTNLNSFGFQRTPQT